MTKNYLLFLFIYLAVAFIVSFFSQKLLLKISKKHNLYDFSDDRKPVKSPRPRIGGFGVFMGFLVSTYLMVFSIFIFGNKIVQIPLEVNKLTVFLYIGAVIFVFILGIIDDFYSLKAFPKLVIEVLVASLFYIIGFKIKLVSIPFSTGQVDLGLLSYLITVLWIVGIINAINLIDGLDGLAGGVIAFSSLATIIILIIQKEYTYVALLVPLLGGVLGFLPFNIYPSKIFMGDGGSLFSGVILSTIIIKTSQKASLGISLMVPLAILALPILDTSLAFIRRILKGKNPFAPDSEHIHHRFLKKGFKEKTAVNILLGISGVFSLIAVLFYSSAVKVRSLLVILFFIIIIAIIWYLGYIRIKKRRPKP